MFFLLVLISCCDSTFVFIRFACGDMTFEESYIKTGRILCIALSATTKKTPPILINYISAPNVTIASAVIASAAVPGFVSPQQLQIKDRDGKVRSNGPETYFDGSIRHDIPAAGKITFFQAYLYNVSHQGIK